jgi:RES domain-containing protein
VGDLLAYRQIDPAFPPLWYGAGKKTLRQESGRWHREGRGVAQYLSMSPHGAWAELIRYEGIRTEERRLEHRRRLCQMLISDHRIADLSSFDHYLECGLSPEWAIGDHAGCQALGDQLAVAGFDGVLSPSAAYDIADAVNLTLFGERIENWVTGAMPDPAALVRVHDFLPTIEITDSGVPTRQAMENTCYRAADHQTFAAWSAASGYRP